MSNVISQWAPQTGYECRTFPVTSDTWSPTESVVARYLLHLRVLGLEDPTKPKATDLYEQALALRQHSIDVAPKRDEDAIIANRLAHGEITTDEAAKLLAKVPLPNDAQEQVERTRQMLTNATRAAYAGAVRSIHLYEKWIDLLRPLVADAVAARDQERWDALHGFAALLRQRGLGALAMVATDPTGIREFEETWRYTVGRPDRYHLWRLEHATAAQAVGHEAVGQSVFVAATVIKGPHPTLADMVAGEMEPTILAASEVLAIADRIRVEQDAARMSAEAPAPSRRARTQVTS
jgi:hypothetical protein